VDAWPHPAIVIEIPVEAAPRVFMHGTTDGDEARVLDWIRSQDELAELVQRALELAEEAKAA
jgi:hypothetical protein